MITTLVGIIFVLLMGFTLSAISSLSIITGPVVGLALVFLMIITKTTKLTPLIQVFLVLFCTHNPLFAYFCLGTMWGCKALIKASRTLIGQTQVEGLEEGVIGESIDDINNQWFISYFWISGLLLGGLISGTLFGFGVIKGFSQLLLSVSIFGSPLIWILYICQLKTSGEGISKFILGGIISCVTFIISLAFLFKGSMLGMLIPFLFLSSGSGNTTKIGIKFDPSQIHDNIMDAGLHPSVVWYIYAIGLYRSMFAFFSGFIFVNLLNKEYERELTQEDKFSNYCHSESIGEALQPIMLWGYLVSRGEMSSFSQLGMNYILSGEELIILILLMGGIQALFFHMRKDLLFWMINQELLSFPFNFMGVTINLEELIIIGITLILGSVIMDSVTPVTMILALVALHKFLVKVLNIPELSQGIAFTFVPIGLYLLG